MNSILHILAGTERGGCEVNALNLVKATPNLAHYLLVLSQAGPMSPEFASAGVTVRHAGVLGSGMRRRIRSVEDAIVDWAPTGVIAWHGMVALPEILRALRDYPGRVLVHGGNPAHSMSRLVDWRYYLTEKFLGRRCEATYVCCSRFVASSFSVSRYLRRFRRVVVSNGTKPLSVTSHVPRTIGVNDPALVGMVARLDGIKDHDTLLRAFSHILVSYSEARLELIGDGELRGTLEKLAKDLGISNKVVFYGMVSDVFDVMQHWDLFAYATTSREGLGNALTEAMQLGLPCVVTDVGPMREVVGDPASTILVPPSDPACLASAIQNLLGSLRDRTMIARAGRIRALKEFSLEHFAQRYIEALNVDPKDPI